jgi:hypothetical protein
MAVHQIYNEVEAESATLGLVTPIILVCESKSQGKRRFEFDLPLAEGSSC